MTRKDFRELAEALGKHDAPNAVIRVICDVCKRNNPQFDRAKFLAAVSAAYVSNHTSYVTKDKQSS